MSRIWSTITLPKKFVFLGPFLVIGFIMLVHSCHSSKESQSDNSTGPKAQEQQKNGNDKQADSRNDSIFFSLKKTPCYGECPVYKFVIYNNGKGKYHGRQFVEKEGTYTSSDLQDEKQAILRYAQKINFFDLAGKYPRDRKAPSDFSQTITYLSLPKQSHRVVNKGMGAPEKLRDFEAFTDSLLKEVPWQK